MPPVTVGACRTLDGGEQMARDLGRGVTGQDVRVVQDRLNYHLRRETALVVDGAFGTETHKRVVKFQTLHGLRIDGIVGVRTRAALFEADVVTAQVLVVPDLTLPRIGAGAGTPLGIKPPQLIPPLTLPSVTPQTPQFVLQPPVLFGPQFVLGGVGAMGFTPVNQPSLLNLTFTAVPVKDPTDPVVQSTKNIIQLIQQLPVDSKFKATVISLVPNPVKTIKEPGAGFDIDIGIPKYSPLDPNKASQSGSAQYNLRIFGSPGGTTPLVMLQGRAEGEIEINYTGQARSNYFKATAQCNFFLGVVGVF
jgi:peptidoglycan hydrolase-like protein with peptidoglycan-binding domain